MLKTIRKVGSVAALHVAEAPVALAVEDPPRGGCRFRDVGGVVRIALAPWSQLAHWGGLIVGSIFRWHVAPVSCTLRSPLLRLVDRSERSLAPV